jgi:hypothetical protein
VSRSVCLVPADQLQVLMRAKQDQAVEGRHPFQQVGCPLSRRVVADTRHVARRPAVARLARRLCSVSCLVNAGTRDILARETERHVLELRLPGRFEVRRQHERVSIPSRPAQSLLAYLVLSAGTAHRGEKLATLLWPEPTKTTHEAICATRSGGRAKPLKASSTRRPPRKRAVEGPARCDVAQRAQRIARFR